MPIDIKKRKAVHVIGTFGITAWTKPLVDSVILPAHAQISTSQIAPESVFSFELSLSENDIVLSRTRTSAEIVVTLQNTGNIPITATGTRFNYSYNVDPSAPPPVIPPNLPPGATVFPDEPILIPPIIVRNLEVQPAETATIGSLQFFTSYSIYRGHPYDGGIGEFILSVVSEKGNQSQREDFTFQTLP